MTKNLKETIVDILDRKVPTGDVYLFKKDDIFVSYIYADRNDYISDSTYKDIFNSDNPREYFLSLMSDWYCDADSSIYSELIDVIQDELNDLEIDDEAIRDVLYDIVSVEYPYEHYLNDNLKVNLVVDTGDGNYDFTLNNPTSCRTLNFSEEYNKSSILWLAKQQGYSKKDLIGAINYYKYNNSVFLKSMSEEVDNVCSHMNALSFLLDMTFGELLEYYDNKDSISSITVSKNTRTGLIDYWYGAGSIVGIELEKDVIIPVEFIDSLTVDGCRGSYGIENTYGFSSNAWNGIAKFNNITIQKAI